MTPAEIRTARRQLGLTQAGLARMLGYSSRAKICDIEAGRKTPSESVLRLLRAFVDGYRPDDWPG